MNFLTILWQINRVKKIILKNLLLIVIKHMYKKTDSKIVL